MKNDNFNINEKEKQEQKKLVKIRLGIWVAILCVLLTSFILLMSTESWGSFINVNVGGLRYRNEDSYNVGNGRVDGNKVKNLDLNWVSGEINLTVYDGEEIVIEENEDNMDEDKKLRYWLDNDTLRIQFQKSRKISFNLFKLFKKNEVSGKTLELKLPKKYCENIKKIDIDAVSSDINTKNIDKDLLKLNELEIDVTSGDANLENIKVKDFKFDKTKGKLNFVGEAENIKVDSTSGRTVLDLNNCPSKCKVDGTSGDINISLPENDGFTVEADQVSGDFKSGFETRKEDDDEYVYKNGSAKFELDTTSGDIEINKK